VNRAIITPHKGILDTIVIFIFSSFWTEPRCSGYVSYFNLYAHKLILLIPTSITGYELASMEPHSLVMELCHLQSKLIIFYKTLFYFIHVSDGLFLGCFGWEVIFTFAKNRCYCGKVCAFYRFLFFKEPNLYSYL
jgi:hypothetical protein